MRTISTLKALMIFASSLLFVQCTSEPKTIAGADGADGVDGTASCVACHSNSHLDPIKSAYAISGHAIGETFARGTSGSCAACHSNEGFIDFVNLGEANPDGYTNPTVISCTTCHDKHGSFDFNNDGYDFALRTFEPVPLRLINPDYSIDLGDKSNTCVNCHQPRRSDPTDDGTGTYEVTSTHWGPHHGPQATVLEGMGGAQLAGSVSYPAVGSATHRSGSSCVKCHMGETTDGNDGSHSNWATENACIACHTSGAPSEVSGLASDLAMLEILLANVVSQDGTVTGIVHDGHPQLGTFTITQAQAAWNYLTVMEDKSKGVHNPAYTKALIKNSIEALD
jgi:hypothetical protein